MASRSKLPQSKQEQYVLAPSSVLARLAWPLRKDDTHNSRRIDFFFFVNVNVSVMVSVNANVVNVNVNVNAHANANVNVLVSVRALATPSALRP